MVVVVPSGSRGAYSLQSRTWEAAGRFEEEEGGRQDARDVMESQVSMPLN